MRKKWFTVGGLYLLLAGVLYSQPGRVTAVMGEKAVTVKINGKLFCRYRFVDERFNKKPYLYPLVGPLSGKSLTTESSQPYPHHNSMWFGCDNINGADFWHFQIPRGKQVSEKPVILTASGRRAVFEAVCNWDPGLRNSVPVMRDYRRIAIEAPDAKTRIIDFNVVWVALTDIHIKKTNHSLFAVRVAPDIAEKAGGTILAPDGSKGASSLFGKCYPWLDYYNKRGGITEGVAILQHPLNRWSDSPWFTRDYGFFSPTPMYWLDPGGLDIKKGEAVYLAYRVIVHAGNTAEADIARRYRIYSTMRPEPVSLYTEHVLNDVLPRIANYKWGQSRRNLMSVAELCRRFSGTPVMAEKFEDKLIALLSQPGITDDARRFVCNQLALVGTDKSVTPLAKQVLRGSQHVAEQAVSALAAMNSAKARKAMRLLLPRVSGSVRSELIHDLGSAANYAAIPELLELAHGKDEALAARAAGALGRIGGNPAADALLKLWNAGQKSDAVADAIFEMLDKSEVDKQKAADICRAVYTDSKYNRYRLLAVRYMATGKARDFSLLSDALASSDAALRMGAIGLLRSLPVDLAAPMLLKQLARTSNPDEMVLLLGVVEQLNAESCVEITRAAAVADNKAVRAAGYRALAKIGGAPDVGLLLRQGGTDSSALSALADLVRAQPQLAQQLIKLLPELQPAAQRRLLDVMAECGDAIYSDAVYNLAENGSRSVRLYAYKALGSVGDINTVRQLVCKLNDENLSTSLRSTIEKSIVNIVIHSGDRREEIARELAGALPAASTVGKVTLLRILGKLKDEVTLPAIIKLTGASNPEVRDAAIRALINWPRDSAIKPLIDVAARRNCDTRHNILALQAVARLLKNSDVPKDDLLPLYKAASKAARRDEERRLFVINWVPLMYFKAHSTGTCKVHAGGMKVGARWTTDREFTFKSVPDSVVGATYIETCMEDKHFNGRDYLTFNVRQPVVVIVAYDSRCTKLPDWLKDWKKSDEKIGLPPTAGCSLRFLSKDFRAGRIVLGGNAAPGVSAIYSAIVKPQSK